mgnify:CR=1 FL=1
MITERERQLKDRNHYPVISTVEASNLFLTLTDKICLWGMERNITAEGGATSYTQIPKLIEEVHEFAGARSEEEAKLEFGDILVVCIQIARLRGLDMVECLELAYDKIRDRKGRMIDGRFVKEIE